MGDKKNVELREGGRERKKLEEKQLKSFLLLNVLYETISSVSIPFLFSHKQM